ncbi:hypothetical protein VSDG_04682 [Cytospora chrysosperma]|uniref:Uncharacterized protein n=1 Tax=Cytospora chrysosperma TaxID=252740 RepID=A0A423W1T0_CYTCH|nr:hypothetical protein VSDG_04682 [Valsa sordida]
MASSQQGRLGVGRQSRSPVVEPGRGLENIAPTGSTPAAVKAAPQSQHNDDTWVEIASQPSSSSLSSIGDEIVTTGLRVGNQSYPPRRRRSQRQHNQQRSEQQHMPPSYVVSHAAAQAGTSSQEEYDETESEEDHIITSSTENIDPRPASGTIGLPRSQTALGLGTDLSDSEDDDDGTALGRPTGFRPQPNAFSHPPAHLSQRSHSTHSAIPPHHPGVRPSTYTHRSHNRPRTDLTSPAYQADNDAALRASLTTLLSCAAAAKNLPGRRSAAVGPSSGEPVLGAGVGPSSQPMELRLVPESEIGAGGSPAPGPAAAKSSPRARQSTTRTTSNSSAQSVPASTSSEDKGKRTAYTSQPKSQRATKKKRTSAAGVDDNAVTWISPATLTWVLGTGVVLLVSVVGFGAGFVVGREVGRQDIMGSMSGGSPAGVNASSCGGEVIRSTSTGTLRRWRWGSGMTRLVTPACKHSGTERKSLDSDATIRNKTLWLARLG